MLHSSFSFYLSETDSKETKDSRKQKDCCHISLIYYDSQAHSVMYTALTSYVAVEPP